MPWKETCTMQEKRLFIQAWLNRDLKFTSLCERFDISTKTGYKWVNRFCEQGWQGLSDRSRARHTQAHRTADAVVDQILAFRDRVGPFGTLLYTGHDWQDADLGKRSMELMATDVMPRVNAALGE